MKERIKKMIIILLVMIGIITAEALIYVYLPSWVYYSLAGLVAVWILYYGSKPDKEDDLHKKIQRLNDLTTLRDWIGGNLDYEDMKIKIMDEQEEIVKSIKL